MQLFTTHKVEEDLDIRGYRYLTIRKEEENKVFWKFSNRLCPAKTTMEDDIVKDVRGDHNHVTNSVKNKAEKMNEESQREN